MRRNNNPGSTPRPSFNLRRHFLLSTLVATLLGGCASLQQKPEDIVKQRAQERWTALLGGKFEQAYSYLTPAFRKAVPADHYQARFGNAGRWREAKVTKVECSSADTCEATIDVQLSVAMMRGQIVRTDAKETWLLVDGEWWMFQKP